MKIEKWNEDWRFWVEKNAFSLVWNVPEDAAVVTVPHDAMIAQKPYAESRNGSDGSFRDGENYIYVKHLQAPDDLEGQTLFLKFDGVYMNANVFVNGELAAKCPYGYTGFYVPLHTYLNAGEENEIRVLVKNGAMPNARWYSGGGIYRDVYLMKAGLCYLAPEGIQVTTKQTESDYATLQIETQVCNRSTGVKELVIETSILDPAGNVAGCEKTAIYVNENDDRVQRQTILVENPQCWSAETPYLYQYQTKLWSGEELLDETEGRFGIRTLQLDAKQGLRVNGETVKLRGACIHHDSGLLGAATYRDAQLRQIGKLKEAGFNAVRMAHQPMAPEMLKACDEIGMYVMDEAFDVWNRSKSDFDYSLYFTEWWEKDLTAMVRKDYNHPSVIMYSVGNEIPEIGMKHGSQLAHQLCETVHSLDSSRYTIASVNGIFASSDKVGEIMADVVETLKKEGKEVHVEGNVNDFMTLMDSHLDELVVHPVISSRLANACASADIAGYNYMTARYEKDALEYPNRVMVGSETYPPEIARNWSVVKKLPALIGDFTWTGWDYIGEAGVGVPAYQWGEGGFGAHFPCQLAYTGDFDLTGYRRPASYYREIVFGLRKVPYVTVQNPHHYGEHLIRTPWVLSDSASTWTWNVEAGAPVIVEVYAMGDRVEFYKNGILQETQTREAEHDGRWYFDTTYESGEIKAIAYEGDVCLGAMQLQSAGQERRLQMQVEEGERKELIYLPIEIRDEAGTLICDAEETLKVKATGDVTIAGFGSGDPKTSYNYNEQETATFGGRALLILKKGKDYAGAEVTISGEEHQVTLQLTK